MVYVAALASASRVATLPVDRIGHVCLQTLEPAYCSRQHIQMRLQPGMADTTKLSSIQEGFTLYWHRSVVSSAAVAIRDGRARGALLLSW